MGIRNRWKKRDWLVIDEESGLTKYASELQQDYRGLYVTKRYADDEQPQDFVKPLNDPYSVPFSNLPNRNFDVCNSFSYTIGNTDIKAPQTNVPGWNYYAIPGISSMQIGCDFVVRETDVLYWITGGGDKITTDTNQELVFEDDR